MNNTEAKLLSAVLEDKQIHVLLQANVDNLLRTHSDIWNFIRNYSEHNAALPPTTLVVEKFRDFEPIKDVGSTKHHLEELQTEYLNDSLKDIIRSAASEIQLGQGNLALESLIQKKECVLFFMADRYPVRCFILKSNRSVNEKEFTGWLKRFHYNIESYGSGNEGKENAYILYNKHKKTKQ